MNTIKLSFFVLILLGYTLSNAQNSTRHPLEKYGYKIPVLTMTNGKYYEYFDDDTLVQIGTVMFNTNTNKVVAFVKYDTLFTETGYAPDVSSHFISIDPHADRYVSISPYAYAANNPINNIDPDGRDVIFSVDRDKKGNITGVNVSSTIHITGEGASEERADELNAASGDVFKSRSVNNVKVSFNIKYKYSKDIKTKDLKQGDNILTFINKPSTQIDRSHVDSRGYQDGKMIIKTHTGRTGQVYKDDWNNVNAVFHETLHFTGLSDRYHPLYFDPLFGFENDIMGSPFTSNRIGYDHYNAYYNAATNPANSKYLPSFIYRGFVDTQGAGTTTPSQQQIDEQDE